MPIRPATLADLDAIEAMVAKTCAYHQALAPLKYPFLPEPAKRYRGWLSRCIQSDSGVFLVAGTGEALVGFTIATIEDEIPIYRIKRFAFVQDLWVEPEHRRHGWARQLVMELAARFRALGIEQIRLDVLVQNPEARQLFASCGFSESVVEMILPLSSSPGA